MVKKPQKIRVAELFAGVGGFRLGLEGASDIFEIAWSNQWEPSTKKQHASETYIRAFGLDNHSNEDISKVPTDKIPHHDLLVGGFPCQDYSVARTLSHAAGLSGKKGVLWWEIHRIIKEKGSKAPSFLMLENVDRLLKSPASQRGRDFAVMLASLSDLGYVVEWRVINAADYGMPQRRRRTYIMGYKKGTDLYKEAKKSNHLAWISESGPMAEAFKVEKPEKFETFEIKGELTDVTENFNKGKKTTPFETAGIIVDRKVCTFKTKPVFKGKRAVIGDIIFDEKKIPDEYFIDDTESLKEWKYLKGGKSEKRKTKDGFTYNYTEGPMIFPDPLNKPSRTIVTGEGGSAPSRFKHVIQTESGRLRRLLPEELEMLNMFPKGHTKGETPTKRAFFMGNALVVGVIKKLGEILAKRS